MLCQALCMISKPSVNSKCSVQVKISNSFSCELQIWQLTLKNNRAPLLCYFKFCAPFHSHLWIQSGVQSGNAQFGSKSDIFFSCVTSKFGGWLWKTIGHHFYATATFVHHFIAMCGFKLELQSGNAQIGAKFVWTSVTLTFDLYLCMDITFVNGNNSWKIHDNTMTGTMWKRCHRRMDRRTEVFLQLLGCS